MTGGGSRALVWAGLAIVTLVACKAEPERTRANAQPVPVQSSPPRARPGPALPLVAFERDFIDVELRHGEARVIDVRLTGVRALAAAIRVNEPIPSGVELDVLPADARTPAGLRLRFKGVRSGVSVGRIAAATGLDEPAEVALNFTLRVPGTLEVSPTNPYFNLRDAGEKTQIIEVRSSQPGFRVLAVEVPDGPFAASFDSGSEPGRYRVKVTVREELVVDDVRGVNGRLVIVSNDRTEPRKELPLLGLGKLNRRDR